MNSDLKVNPKFDHAFAIVRYDTDAGPIEARVTVKRIVLDSDLAEAEVKRLNELNQDKGCYYFYQVTRIDKGILESVSLQSAAEAVDSTNS